MVYVSVKVKVSLYWVDIGFFYGTMNPAVIQIGIKIKNYHEFNIATNSGKKSHIENSIPSLY